MNLTTITGPAGARKTSMLICAANLEVGPGRTVRFTSTEVTPAGLLAMGLSRLVHIETVPMKEGDPIESVTVFGVDGAVLGRWEVRRAKKEGHDAPAVESPPAPPTPSRSWRLVTRLRAVFRSAFGFAPHLLIVLGLLQNLYATDATEHLTALLSVVAAVLFLALDRLVEEIKGIRAEIAGGLVDLRADLAAQAERPVNIEIVTSMAEEPDDGNN